jgi:hypothetical protein
MIMKLDHIGFIDISDELKNGCDQWKNMVTRGWGSFLYMYIVKTCQQSRRHIFCAIFIWSENLFPGYIQCLSFKMVLIPRNMDARGGDGFPYIYLVKKLFLPNHHGTWIISDEFRNGRNQWKNMTTKDRAVFSICLK